MPSAPRAGSMVQRQQRRAAFDRRTPTPPAAAASAAVKGELGWPPLALFRAVLLATWHDLSDIRLAEALDGRDSFRRFCGFAAHEPTPERTAFVRFRRELVARGLDGELFETVTRQLDARRGGQDRHTGRCRRDRVGHIQRRGGPLGGPPTPCGGARRHGARGLRP